MNQSKKQMVIVVSLFCLLIGIAVMPLFMVNYNNSKMKDSLRVTALSPESSLDNPLQSQKYDALDRMQIIQSTRSKENETVVEWQENTLPEEKCSQLVKVMESQLISLQDLKAIPKLTFSEKYSDTIARKMFISMENPNNPVNIWRLYVSYSDFMVSAYMDAETSVLYQVSIIPKTKKLIYDVQGVSEKGFLEYLKKHSESIYKGQERFEAEGHYSEKMIKLFPISYNDKLNVVTWYDLGNESGFIIASEREK